MTTTNAASIDSYLRELQDRHATDLLITADTPPLMRIDGVLVRLSDAKPLSPSDTELIIHGLLGDELTARLEQEREVDFSFAWGEHARFRANAFHQRGSVALALRFIPNRIPGFEELGLPPVFDRLVRLPQGLVLVTGPTGAGKSTTLASMIDAINGQRACHIITIEDPIEYMYEHKRSAIEQREVGVDTDSFARALRAAFREDPDVLLVGEMRDNETIQATLTLAETGHLVFATLHTNDAAQTLDRIVDVFPAEQQSQIRVQVAGTLEAIVSQRLIPKGGGGMVAAFEILIATYAVRNIVRDGRTNQLRNVISTSSQDGMQTLEASLSQLVAQGQISHEQAVTHTLHPDEVHAVTSAPEN
jgi:twitching motility protein PilT